MQNALWACVAIAISSAPVGVFLVLRRMTLMSDAMSHALLPGVALGFLISGLSISSMAIGGFIAGAIVALGAGVITRNSIIREDASLAVFFLISLALGVVIISSKGNNIDLLHLLFGSVLAIDNQTLIFLFSISLITILVFMIIYKILIIECLDSGYLQSINRYLGGIVHYLYLTLVVLNLIAGFFALGTLMSVGMMVLPAVTARFWQKKLLSMIFLCAIFSLTGAYIGLILSYYFSIPISPSIILVLGCFYVCSLLFAPYGVIRYQKPPSQHLKA